MTKDLEHIENSNPQIINFVSLSSFEDEHLSLNLLNEMFSSVNLPGKESRVVLSEDNLQEVLKWDSPNLISQIKKRYNKGKNKVVINKVLPIIDDRAFFNFIMREQIPFSSEEDPELANKYCSTLLFLGKQKGLRKAGNPNGGDNYINKANDFAKEIGPIIDKADKDGHKTYREKASYLNKNDISAIRGGDWSASSVRGVWNRWKTLNSPK